MRRIALIYTRGNDDQVAGLINSSFCGKEYEIESFPLDNKITIEQIYERLKSFSLIITLNLAGFSYRNSGNNSVYATLENNSIHYVNRHVVDEEKLLEGLITVTMLFLTDSDDIRDHLLSEYRRIHDVTIIKSLSEEIKTIVDNLDWRKEE